MSKPAIGIVVFVLATLLSSVAIGKGGGHGGGHGGVMATGMAVVIGGGHRHFGGHHGHFGGHHGGGKFAISRSFSRGSFRGHRALCRAARPELSARSATPRYDPETSAMR